MTAAVIVLYNPDLNLLGRLLRAISGQIDRLIVVDNCVAPDSALRCLLIHYATDACYIPLGENRGIATAQNIGIRQAMESGASHVLLLDQDSAPSPEMVAALMETERTLLDSGIQVAAVGPVFIDVKTGTPSTAVRHRFLRVRKLDIDRNSAEPVEADYLIASGCLIRASVLTDVGMMREELFIDWVDIEWGLRARRKGYRSFIAPRAVMSHSIGDATVRAIGKEINLHNETRNYYIVRNATYLLRWESMGWNWRLITACKIPQYILFYSWHSRERLKSFILLVRALLHGLRGRLGPLANPQK